MAIPIAAILAAANLISQGVGKIGERRRARAQADRAKNDLYIEHALDAGAEAGGDVSGGRMTWAQHGIDRQLGEALHGIDSRPVDYGGAVGAIQGSTSALGGKGAGIGAESQPGTAPRLSIGSPEDYEPATGGYISQSRIQAPIVISGPDRGTRRNPDDEDWYGNYA
jgi:hypothetical protein